jgi:putative membrane protein
MMKHDYEKEYQCSACTPLGILGHELDLASQIQNRKIIKEVLEKANFQSLQSTASPFVRVTSGCAIASCQIFGDTAFISFSLAPQTTEDLPQELGHMVTDEIKKYGLKHAVLVNAHNALDEDSVDMNEHLEELKQAAFGCLQKATKLPTALFKVGAATIYPKNFTQKQGMGTGGITAVVIEVNKQKTAYITIDGNNIIPKLREKILGSLASLGFDESEVFTTDTHAVSALVTGKRGYHPIGEAIDQDQLINYIGQAAKEAIVNLEESSAGFLQFVVPQVRVIGEDRLQSISTLVDKAIVKAKKVAAPIFGTEGLIFILLLLLF